METVSVILTVVLLAILVIAIVKKFNILTTLIFLTFVGLFLATVMNGTSVLGDSGTGNMWLDIFDQFRATFSSTLAANGLLIMVVMGFSGYMNKIKASDMFAGLVAIPVSKIKAKWLLIIIAPFLGLLFNLIIPSGMSAFVVALSTIYPILVAVGVNPITAAIALLFGANTMSGPSNPFVAMCLQMMGLDINVSDFFFQYALVPVLLVELVIGIVLIFWSGICNKKDDGASSAEVAVLDINSLGIPKWYALFPLIPLVFIIIFSSFATGGQFGVITVPGAYIMSFVIAVLLHVLVSKPGTRKAAFDECGPLFFDEAGVAFSKVVSVVALGTFYSVALSALGGITVAINFLVEGLGLGFWPMLVIFWALFFIMSVLAGPTLAIPILAPAIATLAAQTGMEAALPAACFIFMFGGSFGLFLMPYDPKLLMIAQMFNVDVTVVMKRTSVPCIAAAIASLIFGIIFIAMPVM